MFFLKRVYTTRSREPLTSTKLTQKSSTLSMGKLRLNVAALGCTSETEMYFTSFNYRVSNANKTIFPRKNELN